jgi:hypothetical protein
VITFYEQEGFFMNVNRQNNCYSGRQGVRPVNVIGASQGCNVTPVQGGGCCGDTVIGNIIFGGCADADCNKETTLSGCPIAMAYVPWQSYGNIYPLQQAIQRGTMFRELDLDFAGRRCN